MNSLVSYNWLSEYVNLKKITPEEFARRVSLSGPGVEKLYPAASCVGATSTSPLDDRIVVGHIVDIQPHPNADKLRIVTVDIGRGEPRVRPSRDQGDDKHRPYVHIVCGGTNIAKGQWVAVALVGARVKWHGEGELVTLEPAEIRGVKSDGMICASNEIGLGDAFPAPEREILDLSVIVGANLAFAHQKARAMTSIAPTPGTPLADLLGLSDDVVMDIEVTTNRVDAMGMMGMAREAAAILDVSFTWKPAKLPVGAHGHAPKNGRPPVVKISAKKQCARFMSAKIEGVEVKESPWWLKRRLLSAGIRPINNIVDVSNYVLLELAQPIHIYDATKLNGGLEVRLARHEKIKALDGRTYDLDDSILVIADTDKPVAIAGIMGGEETGVTSATTDVVIEVANFDAMTIRRGARKLNIQTDAHQRYEKGLSTAALPFAMARAIELIKELGGGKLAGGIADAGQTSYKPLKFSVTTDEVNALIGVPRTQKEMVNVLRRLGFEVKTTGKKMTATVPWWRDHDIEDGRDLVEEIARIGGYAAIPAIVPVGIANRPKSAELKYEQWLRDLSKGAGLTETYTYSFVPKELMTRAGYDPETMLAVQNPLSEDFAVMRTTMLPSLLQVASENRERESDIRLFEIANVYYPPSNGRWTDLPDEQLEVAALFYGMKEPWRHAKGYVEHVLHEMGMAELSWKRLASDSFWHPGRTVQAFYKGNLVATVGEVSPKIAMNFKLEKAVGLVDIPFETVITHAKGGRAYIPVSAYPEAKRDLAVMVDARVEYDDLARSIQKTDTLIREVEWFDTYQGPAVGGTSKNLPTGKKSVAMHVTMSAADRTLESREVDGIMERAVLALKESFGAELRA